MSKTSSPFSQQVSSSDHLPSFHRCQEIIETHTIESVLPLIDSETWLIVDLDNTLFQAKQALGHVHWFEHEMNKHIAAGKSQEEASLAFYPLWKKTQMMTEVMPVESKFVETIKEMQNDRLVVMALTHRQLFIVPETLQQLNSIGLNLALTAPSKETFHISATQPALYTQGILFVDDFNTKGEVFRMLLQTLELKPKKIVFVDDKKANVENMAHAAGVEDIEYIGVYYTAVEHGPQIYSTALAEHQLQFFNCIMSNQQSLHLLAQDKNSG